VDNPNDTEEDCLADTESDIEINHGIVDPECPGQQDVSATPNVPTLVQAMQKSMKQAEKMLVMVNAIEMR
jgi:hypothetical protein